MQDLVDLLCESLVLRTQRRDDGGGGGGGGFGDLVGKIGSIIQKSQIGLFSKSPIRALPPAASKDDAQPIRWHKGELIGSGAFGRVYMGMNLDSEELIAVKQVYIENRPTKHYVSNVCWIPIIYAGLNQNRIYNSEIWGGCVSTISTGTGTSPIVEAILTLEDA